MLVGNIDDVKRDIEQAEQATNVEWFGWYFEQGHMSLDETRRQLEIVRKDHRRVEALRRD